MARVDVGQISGEMAYGDNVPIGITGQILVEIAHKYGGIFISCLQLGSRTTSGTFTSNVQFGAVSTSGTFTNGVRLG